jgi:N-glycosidase YbiA
MTPILFSSKSADYGWLSNFSTEGFTLDAVRWPSVEQYYQAQKFAGTAAVERIRSADSPLKARKAGQDRSLVPRADWDDIKEDVMRLALRAKFTQNRRLRERLVATGDAALVHASSSDVFWGQTADGVGENRLGVLLMELRATL